MERTQPERGGGPNNKSALSLSSSSSSSSSLPSSSWESVDSTIQSAAEGHLASVYALELNATPTHQVLLTVLSANPDDPGEGSGSGIVVRRSFLGGVVGLPPGGPPPPRKVGA